MGAHSSTLAVHGRIDSVIPHLNFELSRGTKSHRTLIENVTPLFPAGPYDRGQFIHSLRILLSANGQLPLNKMRFKLVFTQPPKDALATDEEEQVFVSLVAIDVDGVIAAKIASERPGVDNIEAFQMFRKTVEMRMHEMLETIPTPDAAAASSAAAAAAAATTTHSLQSMSAPVINNEQNHSVTTLASTVLQEEPPAYQEATK